jgi:hypothetical protein
MKPYLITLLLNLRELLVAIDQFLNVLVCLVGGRIGYSDETLSAHCWRSFREGKFWGRVCMPPIDWMFSWQKSDPAYVDDSNVPITGHCRRAYEKEKARDYLPPEYRKTHPPTR